MIINGKQTIATSTNIKDLLIELNIDDKLIAIEVNFEIIPKSEYQFFTIKEEDKIEIINAVGGG